ncbi:MAG: hypothetical protein Q8R36_00510 [bacterium]|nr:hypothetical protein [bacterium]
MDSRITVRTRIEFQSLFLNVYGVRYRLHTSGTDKEKIGPELRAVFGKQNIPALTVANYLCGPERIMREVAKYDASGNDVTLGKSEIPDNTFWPCREMFIALSGTEPVSICRMFIAELVYVVLWHDLERRGLNPSISPVGAALEMFRELSQEPDKTDQQKIMKVYDLLQVTYSKVKQGGFVDRYSQAVLVAMEVLGYYSKYFYVVSETFPWFDLMHIVYSRRFTGGAPCYASLPTPTVTSNDLVMMVKMLLRGEPSVTERLIIQKTSTN